MSAFLEHALGTDESDPASGLDALTIARGSDGTVTVSLTKNLAADDAVLELEVSSDLTSWLRAEDELVGFNRVNLGDGTARWDYTLEGGEGSSWFVRARAALRE